MRRRTAAGIVLGLFVLAMLFASTLALAAPAPAPTGAIAETGKAAADVGQVFVQGKTDGLILYALILGTFLMFLVAVAVLYFGSRERIKAAEKCAEQAKAFADASLESSEALRDVATALASTGSANLAFQQSQAGLMQRLEIHLERAERKAR